MSAALLSSEAVCVYGGMATGCGTKGALSGEFFLFFVFSCLCVLCRTNPKMSLGLGDEHGATEFNTNPHPFVAAPAARVRYE